MRVLLFATLALSCSGSAATAPAPAKPTACDDRSVLTASGCVVVGVTTETKSPPPACERGTFALPGEQACRAPTTIALDGDALHVDAAASPGGDGSASRPFRTIQAAVTAATAGARVSVAAGVYRENVRITRPISLIGAGAARVEIAGTASGTATVIVRAETTLAGVAITGNGIGVAVTDTKATLSNVWVHDTAIVGVNVDLETGASSVHIEESLIESAAYAGVAGFGAEVTIVRSALRDTRLYENKGGPGALAAYAKGKRPKLVVQGSVIERNREVGVGVSGGELVVEDSIVQGTEAMANGTVGNGILASVDKASRETPNLTVTRSFVTGNREMGIAINGGVGSIEQTVVEGTRVRASDELYGVGIQADPGASLSVKSCLVAKNRHMGIAFFGATGVIEDTIVRDTTLDGKNRAAVGIAIIEAEGLRSNVTVTRALADKNHFAGIAVGASDAKLIDCSARGSISNAEGLFGDGVVGMGLDATRLPALTIEGLTADKNARAGVTLFGGTAVVRRARLTCNRFDLNTEDYPAPVTLTDGGENVCGCGTEHPCKAASNSLEVQVAPIRGGR